MVKKGREQRSDQNTLHSRERKACRIEQKVKSSQQMGRNYQHRLKLFFLVTIFVSKMGSFSISGAKNDETGTWAGSKYQIDCTMCSACDNPCNTPSPPTPSSPPPPSSGSGSYYGPPPPQTPFSYYQPPPAPGFHGGGGGTYFNPPQMVPAGPAPPPPNPIVPYFPFYYHNPPPSPSSDSSIPLKKAKAFNFIAVALLFSIFIIFN
ncbi:hydroxyproline-rich glycoprotein family protein [Striga asiatica]|uniref:Hydroxyproline-rich glycoprotein family protein n=1 Tax=Striga asiatica TaxID=4170 RepID=A0A5A7QPA4_STRAF|nr:hydroxyproline-rich glycoprotein family protein [Striga asiatica]